MATLSRAVKEVGDITIRISSYDLFVIITIVAIVAIIVIIAIVAFFSIVAIADILVCLFAGDIGIPNDPFTLGGDCEERTAIEWIHWFHYNGSNYGRQWRST